MSKSVSLSLILLKFIVSITNTKKVLLLVS